MDDKNYKASTHEKFRRILKFYYKVVYGNNEHYPEAVNWFSVNLGKEKMGKETNMNMTEYLEEKEVQKLIETAPTLQKKAFLAWWGLFSGLRGQELIYIKEKAICNDGYGFDYEGLHVVDNKNGMTIIAIGWTRGNKKALATILPINYWNKLRTLPKFDYNDIVATHRIMKRDVGIACIAMRKIHYNVMRFREALAVDEAEF